MTKREFYRSVVTIEILSEEPLGDNLSLDGIQYLINNECSGKLEHKMNEKINGEKAASLLLEHGSDPDFFQLDEHGNDGEGTTA